jgi:hypothetical protein
MKSGVIISVVMVTRIASVLFLFVLAQLAQAGERGPASASRLLAMNDFKVEGVRTSNEVLAKFFADCNPDVDSRCPAAPPRCGVEGFNITNSGLDTGAYRSCAALGGASPTGVRADVAQGCSCQAICERTGKPVTGRWNCNQCLAVCE